MMDRTILHCDCNGFYASVECYFHPELKKVPMAVCGDPESRHGIILAKNELAKGYGVITAETVWQAKRKCPSLVLVPPRRKDYVAFSRRINAIYQEYTDLVEPFGIDESWLDVTASRRLFGDGKTIADTLRRRIREEVGVTISVGVSFNKVFAKLGSDYQKPDATTIIDRENFRQIVWPLPVEALLFVGKSVQKTLTAIGVRTIGDLAREDPSFLQSKLGKAGGMLSRYARGEDDAPVASIYEKREAKSVGNGQTFAHSLVVPEEIRREVHALAEEVARRLRKQGLWCETVQLQIRDDAFHTISRQKSLHSPSRTARELTDVALALLHQHWPAGKPIRMLTIQASGLRRDGACQMSLFSAEQEQREKWDKMETAMDAIRCRFGSEAITTADRLKTIRQKEGEGASGKTEKKRQNEAGSP
mgnify:CR=1 FL=1